ncbi:hypothetical protein CAPTEDRAFT_186048 [Capitella teleta]|uniref:Uncharacterized protein n=1 Tax=Capitella teleta TaxID=283909 RepID=R7UMZ0_CAPTE|nr:hypothetical protein CAPTEDRAFT_186048 [Capitella teleta]|eukprot:ELU04761.1 hypothetical protein CAPTEDRAFT_186048 [Capitella teleta]
MAVINGSVFFFFLGLTSFDCFVLDAFILLLAHNSPGRLHLLTPNVITTRGNRVTEHISQLYGRFESVLRVASPQQPVAETEEEKETTPVKYATPVGGAASPTDEFDVISLDDLDETKTERSSVFHDATIGSIQVLELPTELNKSVDSDGKKREKPVCYNKIKQIDKCSSTKNMKDRRPSPIHNRKAKRRLSEEFEAQSKIDARTPKQPVKISPKNIPENIHEVHGVSFGTKPKNESISETITEEDEWFEAEEDQHVYENIQFKEKEVNVDEGLSAKSSAKNSPFHITPPKHPKGSTPGSGSTMKKLTAVKHRMERIIRELGSPDSTLSESMCSTLKKDTSKALTMEDLMNSDSSIQLSDSMYDPVDLSSQLWGKLSPSTTTPSHSPPETIRKCLFTMSRNNSPVRLGECVENDTIMWANSFNSSTCPESVTKADIPANATFTKTSAFLPYSKSSERKQASTGKKLKYCESVVPANNCDYICMNQSARTEVLKSISKQLFATPTLDDMEPVLLPDLTVSDFKLDRPLMSKWFSTPKLQQQQSLTELIKPGEDSDNEADKTLVAHSPSPKSTTSLDSGHGSCASVSPSEACDLKKDWADEPIYETIAESDTYAGLDEVTKAKQPELEEDKQANHTYASIEETITPRPPALPERLQEFNLFERLEKAQGTKPANPPKQVLEPKYPTQTKCQNCLNCPSCPTLQQPQKPVRPEEIIRKTDIVDMDSFHRYTVGDVIESMERLADEIPETRGIIPRSKSRQSLYGMIGDPKTRREISQALELETKLKSNANKYAAPLQPTENTYQVGTVGQRSFQEDDFTRNYKTMPISKVNRLCVERDTHVQQKENYPLQHSKQFSQDNTFRQSRRTRDRSASKKPRSKSIGNRSVVSDDEPSYCNLSDTSGTQYFSRGSRRSLLRIQAKKIKPPKQQEKPGWTTTQAPKVVQAHEQHQTNVPHQQTTKPHQKSFRTAKKTQDIINKMFVDDSFSSKNTIRHAPSQSQDSTYNRRYSDFYGSRPSIQENHRTAMIVDNPPVAKQRNLNQKPKTQRPVSTVIEPKAPEVKSSSSSILGHFRRTKSAMHLKWKGATTTREIFC